MEKFNKSLVYVLLVIVLLLLAIVAKQRTEIYVMRMNINAHNEVVQALSRRHYVLMEMIRLSIYDSTKQKSLKNKGKPLGLLLEW